MYIAKTERKAWELSVRKGMPYAAVRSFWLVGDRYQLRAFGIHPSAIFLGINPRGKL